MNKPNTQQGPLSREVVMVAVNAMRKLRALEQQSIVTKDTDVEKQTARALLSNVLLNNPDELLGTWLTMNAEFSPLVQGVAALLRRAVGLNEQESQMRNAAMQAHAAKAEQAKNPDARPATEAVADEKAAAAVTQGEAPIIIDFGTPNKPAGPVE